VTPFERLRSIVLTTLSEYELAQAQARVGHELYCLCAECVCVRGLRDELESYEKRAAKGRKK